MLLGVLYHAVHAYWPGIAPWYPVEDHVTSGALASFASVLHSFRMELFFALAGFFAQRQLERRRPDAFLRERTRRLLFPFALALPLSIIADLAVRGWARKWGLMSPAYRAHDALRLAPLHLWFLEYLFLFSVLAWGLSRLRLTLPRVNPWAFAGAAFAVTAVLAVYAPEPRPDATFLPLAPVVLHHGLFFIFGWLLGRAPPSRRLWPAFPAGLVLALVLFSRPLQYQPVGHALSALVAWLVTIGAFSLALGFNGEPPAWVRELVDASYWVYLTHYPVVVALHVALTRVQASAGVKYALVVAATLTMTLGTFAALVRKTSLAPWLGARTRLA